MKRYALLASAVTVTGVAAYQGTFVNLQGSTPGTPQNGHLNILGTAKAGTLVGYSNETSGIAYGGDFRSVSTSGRGILGNASATTGATYGGLFQSFSNGGRGVAGIAANTAGTTYGGFFSSLSNQGRGVYGQATNVSGTTYGVYGKAVSPSGFGVYSEGNLHATGILSGNGSGLTAIGDDALSSNIARKNSANLFTGDLNRFSGNFVSVGTRTEPIGTNELFGISSNAAILTGMFISSGVGGRPYYGLSNGGHTQLTTLEPDGTLRWSMNNTARMHLSSDGELKLGSTSQTTTYPTKISVFQDNQTSPAVWVENGDSGSSLVGRIGISAYATGSNGNTGVYGSAASSTSSSRGLFGEANGVASNFGVYGDAGGGTVNYAGYFNGLLYATAASAGVKNFTIDHPADPANKVLSHSSIESDERMNLYRGNVKTASQGFATVSVPSWFDALNEEIQYQLTIIGDESDSFVQVKVAKKIVNGKFKIRTSAGGAEVHWQVSGRRKDPTAKYYPLEVERVKVPGERGKYYAPEAYGKGKEFGIGSMSEIKSPQAESAPRKKK